MATSIVPRAMTTTLLSLALLAGSGILASAQSVQPTNETLPSSETNSVTNLRLSGGPLFDTKSYNIVPLTENAGKGSSVAVSTITPSGVLTPADYTSAANLTSSDIAYISCDPNGSNIDSSTVVAMAGAATPKAIVLYSLESQSCNLTGSYTYTTIFSVTSQKDSIAIKNTIDLFTSNGGTSTIAASIGVNNGTATSGGSSSQSQSTTTPGGPAPTTAVAMSILYSITGIITLLFLVIIATGAIRAHRHPERYGPRNGFAGRPRQSRAKGLARAMLETLPIVKFGDPEPVKPGAGDVELEDGQASTHTPATATAAAVATTASKKEENSKATSDATAPPVESGLGAAQAESVKSGEGTIAKEGELGCSICTEDFTTGEDVRVLPCDHKYHPACIDPWLLNVSGTCPLCRHDLRPVTSATSNPEGAANDDGELPPPLSTTEGAEGAQGRLSGEGSTHHRRRVSRLLDLSRLRHAPPDERIAALRQLRVETQQAGETAAETEEPSRRARLTSRLRDTFRIKTRAQN